MERLRREVEGVAAEGSPLQFPPAECAKIAIRRWMSSARRGVEQDDFERRVEDLVDGLIQHFEADSAFVGRLRVDYRYLASAMAHALEKRPRPAVDTIVASIDRLRSTRYPVLVSVDGMSAAGKSSLARQIAERRRDVVVVSGDDFYRVMNDEERFRLPPELAYQKDFDWQRLMSEAIVPLRQGQSARFQRYDWSGGELGEWVTLEPERVVVVEGVYVSRLELRGLFDLNIWVETPAEVRAARQATRDDPPEWVDRWDRAERYYVTEFAPPDAADLVIVDDTVVL